MFLLRCSEAGGVDHFDRQGCRMSRVAYPSELSEDQWSVLEPLLTV